MPTKNTSILCMVVQTKLVEVVRLYAVIACSILYIHTFIYIYIYMIWYPSGKITPTDFRQAPVPRRVVPAYLHHLMPSSLTPRVVNVTNLRYFPFLFLAYNHRICTQTRAASPSMQNGQSLMPRGSDEGTFQFFCHKVMG